jgi:DNA-binding MarR family transcriptional regulator
MVTKRPSSEDGRGNIAKLTPAGLAKLKAAWPVHLASVRGRVLDHAAPASIAKAAQALAQIADHLEESR